MKKDFDTVRVELGPDSYDIVIGRNAWNNLPDFVAKRNYSRNALIVTDTNVGPLYGEKVKSLLAGAGIRAAVAAIPAGEASKSLTVAEEVFTRAIEGGLDRRSPVIALGGGVAGDLGGFIAAAYMRGVPFIQIPTSLLADVDSSVGGKVAVNHRLGKNLIGAFYQPEGVFIDLDCLKTLPPREISTGLGEILKYGIISDGELFTYLEKNSQAVKELDLEAVRHLIIHSCQIKAEVVSRDEKEGGLRRILNYGHTMAHAIEKEAGYGRYNHGEAVAIGMVCAAHIGAALKLSDEGLLERIEELCCRLGLPTRVENCAVDKMYAAIFHDKKTVNGVVSWVLAPRLGETVITGDVPEEIVKAAMAYCCA